MECPVVDGYYLCVIWDVPESEAIEPRPQVVG
jgi:hypothetical protein